MTRRAPRRPAALWAVAAALLVAGCHATAGAPRIAAAPPAVRPAPITPAAPAAPAVPAAPAAPAPDPAAASVQAEIEAGPPIIAPPPSESATIEVARLPAPAPPPPPSTLNDDPARLMGLDAAALGALLGRPALRRVEPPAEVWQYRGERCVLDVFLYAPGAGEPHVVTYYEIRGGDAPGRRRCLRGLLLASGEG